MKQLIALFFTVILFSSCDYFGLQTKKAEENRVASVGKIDLEKSDIEAILPQNMSAKDSAIWVKSYVNTWAKQQLLLKLAQENISEVSNNEIENLVTEYKNSLYINGYKERLIKQQLDTVVTAEDIQVYYNQNKENFKLNEDLLQIDFIHFGKDFLDKDEVIKKFKSTKEEDKEDLLSMQINFKANRLQDTTWLKVNEVLTKIPPLQSEPKEKLLKISKFIQKEDSLGVYLVAVKKVLKRNDIAPVTHIESTLKQMILHKRKLELIREIEKTLMNDAIKNKTFKEY